MKPTLHDWTLLVILIRSGVLPTTGIRLREEYPLKLAINRKDEEVANHMKQIGDCSRFMSEGRSEFSVFASEGQPLFVHLAVIL